VSQSRASSRRKAAASAVKPKPVSRSPYLWGGIAALLIAVAVAVAGIVLSGQLAGPVAITPQQQADPAFIGPGLHSLVIDPKNPDHIFVGGHASAVVSLDGGKTLSQVKGLQSLDAMNWTLSSDGAQQAVAGHYGLRISTDGGVSWTDLTSNLPNSDVHALGMSPDNPSQLFAYVVGKGVYASDDQGKTWSLRGGQDLSMMGPMVVQPGGNNLLGVDMQSGLVQSTDGGRSWKPVGSGLMVSSLAVDPADRSHLVAVGSTVQQSHDRGATWSSTGGSLPPGTVAIAIAPGAGAPWYAGLMLNQHAVLLHSTDSGATWQAVTQNP
jgi:photosystem II stability/assembly factor-like uncharacterized protein